MTTSITSSKSPAGQEERRDNSYAVSRSSHTYSRRSPMTADDYYPNNQHNDPDLNLNLGNSHNRQQQQQQQPQPQDPGMDSMTDPEAEFIRMKLEEGRHQRYNLPPTPSTPAMRSLTHEPTALDQWKKEQEDQKKMQQEQQQEQKMLRQFRFGDPQQERERDEDEKDFGDFTLDRDRSSSISATPTASSYDTAYRRCSISGSGYDGAERDRGLIQNILKSAMKRRRDSVDRAAYKRQMKNRLLQQHQLPPKEEPHNWENGSELAQEFERAMRDWDRRNMPGHSSGGSSGNLSPHSYGDRQEPPRMRIQARDLSTRSDTTSRDSGRFVAFPVSPRAQETTDASQDENREGRN